MKHKLNIKTISKTLIRFKRGRRRLALISLFLLITLLPLAIFLLRSGGQAEAAWWAGDGSNWLHRKRLALHNTSTESLAVDTTVSISLNTAELYRRGQIREDCADLRVIYHPDENTSTQVPRALTFPKNMNCATSEATHIYFPLQAILGNGADSENYYLYFNNQEAGVPDDDLSAYSIGSKNPLLVCPFDSTTECIDGTMPVEAVDTGSLRHVGLKSGLLFDGQDDYIEAANSSSLSVTGNLTVEGWVKAKWLDEEQTLIAKWDETTANDDRSYRLYLTGGNKFAFEISTDGSSGTVATITGNTSVQKGTWYHVAGVYHAGNQTLDLFVNGVADATQATSVGSSIDNNNSPLYLGAKENSGGTLDTHYKGILDEIRISSVARYVTGFPAVDSPFIRDDFTQALYHLDEAGVDSRDPGKIWDDSSYQNTGTVNGPVYVTGFIGVDGPSEFGSHTGPNSANILTDNQVSWAPDEWIGYIVYNTTDGSSGVVTQNGANVVTAELRGGAVNVWNNGDEYTLSPDAGKSENHSLGSPQSGVFLEEGTVNKIDNPSFENTVYDTSWTEGVGEGLITAITTATAPTSTGTQDITTSDLGGHTPKAAIVIASYGTSDGTAKDHALLSYGATTGSSNQWFVTMRDQDNSTDAGHARSASNSNAVLYMLNPTGTSPGQIAVASVSQFLTNGIRLDWSFAPSSGNEFLITVIFLAGENMEAYAGFFGLGTTVDAVFNVEDPGFEPDLLLTASGQSLLASTLNSFGLVRNNHNSTVSQYAHLRRDNPAINTVSHARTIDTAGFGTTNAIGTALAWWGEFSDFDSLGFTVTIKNGNPSNQNLGYLALAFDDVDPWVGVVDTPTSTGVSSVTSPGYTPQFVFQLMNFTETLGTTVSDDRAGTFGFSTFSANNQYSNVYLTDVGASTTDTKSLRDTKAINQPNGDNSSGIVATYDSFTSTGWNLNYSSVTGTGKKYLATAINSISYLNRAIETEEPFVKFGSRSAKIIADGGNTSLVNAVAPGNTNTHTMSLYAYLGTAGFEGEAIATTSAQIVWEGVAQAGTNYEEVGGGWWRLSYTGSTTNATNDYGVWIADGETLYVDGFQLEEKAYATTFTDGSLGAGYSWSGTINESSSTRAAADLRYPISGNLDASVGSLSFWVKPNWDGNDNRAYTLFDTDTSSGGLKLYKHTDNNLYFTDGTNESTRDISGWQAGEWHLVTLLWGSGSLVVYTDGVYDSASLGFSAPTLGTNFYLGQANDNSGQANAVFADVRIFDARLDQVEMVDLYYAGLVSFSVGPTVEAFDELKGERPVAIWRFNEAYGNTAFDSSLYGNHLTLDGPTWLAPNGRGRDLRGGTLSFDGSNDYLFREPDTDFNFGNGSFTISGWFKLPMSIASQGTILARYGTAGFKVYVKSTGEVCFGIDDDSTWGPDDEVCNNQSLADSTWHHFSAVKTGTTSIALYVDGVKAAEDASLTATGSLNDKARLYLGIDSDGSSNPFKGELDDVMIYPYARTLDQIKTDYAGGQYAMILGAFINDSLSEGLVGYWKMDEAGDTSRLDSSGNGNTLSQSAGDTIDATAGKFGNAADFENSNSEEETLYISDVDQKGLDISGPMTISAWIKPESIPSGMYPIVSKYYSNGNQRAYQLNLNGGTVEFLVSSTGSELLGAKTNTQITSTGTWYHLVGTYDGEKLNVYINGELKENGADNPKSFSGSIFNSTANFRVGGGDSYAAFDGAIDDTRVYNRALSPAEVKALYEWAPGPVGYWNLDRHTNDVSGSGNHGTFAGTDDGKQWVVGKFGSALSFNGADREVTVPDSSTMNFSATDNFTFSAWFKHDGEINQPRTILSKYESTGADGGYKLFMNDDGTITCGVDTDNTGFPLDSATTTTAYDDDAWHHASCVKEGSTALKVYIDGTLAATDSSLTGSGTYANNDPFHLGSDGDSSSVGISHIDTVTGTNEDLTTSISVTSGTVTSNADHFYIAAIGASNSSNMYVDSVTGLGLTWVEIANQCVDNGYMNASVWYGTGTPSGNGTVTAVVNGDPNIEAAVILVSRYSGVNLNDPIGYYAAVNENGVNGGCTETGTDTDNPSVTLTTSTNNLMYAAVQTRNRTITWDQATSRGSATAGDGGNVSTMSVADLQVQSSSETISGVLSAATDWAIIGVEINARSTYWKGELDDVKVYNYARTPQQIVEDMNAGHPAPGSPVGSAFGHWKFDEGYDTTAFNSGYAASNGTIDGASWTNEGKFGKALSFDGTDDRVDLTGAASVKGLTGYTVSAWFKTTTLNGTRRIIYEESNGTTNSSSRIKLAIDTDNKLLFAGRGADGDSFTNWVDSNKTLSTDTWYHVAAVFDSVSNVHYLYLNGEAESNTVSASAIANTAPILGPAIGSRNIVGQREPFDGLIDDVRLYTSALSESQVLAVMNGGFAQALGAISTNTSGDGNFSADLAYCVPGDTATCRAPVAEWNFTENSGTTTQDSAGNGNSGTLTNGPKWVPGRNGTGALEFDGEDDYVSLTDNGSLDLTEFTITSWMNPAVVSSEQKAIFANFQDDNAGNRKGIAFTITDAVNLHLGSATNSWNFPAISFKLFANQWQFVAATFDDSNKTGNLYSDITWAGSYTYGYSPVFSDASPRIGRKHNSALTTNPYEDFVGQIGQIRIYDYVRTRAQLAWDYNRGQAIVHYKFDECTGTILYNSNPFNAITVADANRSTSTNLTLTIGASGTYTSAGTCGSGVSTQAWNAGTNGIRNASLAFDGTNDYADSPNGPLLSRNNQDYSNVSWGAWVKPAGSPTSKIIMSRGTAGNDAQQEFKLSTNASAYPQCEIQDNATTWQTALAGTKALPSGEWSHIICTYDGVNQKIYVNGKLENSAAQTALIRSRTNHRTRIANGTATNAYFAGQIDDVRIYSYALTEQLIKTVVNEGAVRFGP